MTMQTYTSTGRKSLRLWPGVIFATVLVLGRYVVPLVVPDEIEIWSLPLGLVAIFAGMLSAVGIVVWWMFFSRAPWLERIAAVVLMVAAVVVLKPLVHVSVRTGNMGYMLYFYAPPILALAVVVWAVATRHLSAGVRRVSLVAAILLASVPFVLIRTAGVSGTGAQLHWRWTPTPEDRLLAEANDERLSPPLAAAEATPASVDPDPAEPPAAKIEEKPAAPAEDPAAAKAGPAARRTTRPSEWPGFRGTARDSVVRGVRIGTDWSTSPPVQMWRRPIGPGWSSFAVRGDLLYTQEQRGEDEIVACYRVTTGEPVWRHRDRTRFWESNAGAGPRGTPTIDGGRVFALGATGVLNALDARTGKRLWSRNAAIDTGVTIPEWGVASSPLVIDPVVVVAISGQLVAYDAGTGNERWRGPRGGSGYSSPHLVTIDGVQQIVLLRGSRTISVSPADGTLLWEHLWEPGVGIVQPAVAGSDILLTIGDAMGGIGIRRISVAKTSEGWRVEERWTSRGLKPYFNDFVVHEGHAYGFDGSILSAIDLQDGTRKWKGGRYGQGQLVLLADQDLLLVVSEEGELALVSATADQYRELARVPAIEGKTWNHPVVVRDVLLVRNGEEMAAFRLPLVATTTER
jgi:outer membrane protein assembly factor BamB